MLPSCAVLGFACLILGADPAEDVKKELEKFRGTWKWVFMESEGTKLPEATFSSDDGVPALAAHPCRAGPVRYQATTPIATATVAAPASTCRPAL